MATATVLTKSTTTTLEDRKEEDIYTSLENIGLPWLYFGDKTMAKDMHNLRQHHIRYILNCTPTKTEGGIPNYYTTTTSSVNAGINKRSLGGMFEYCRIPMQDNATESLSIWYDTAWNFIDRCRIREDGNILVHCNWGQSRSVSIIISYLIKYYRYTYDDALEAVQKARPEASPNQSFEKQLIKLSKELQSRITTTTITNNK
ncbi:dual specificity protein phosphatase, putative [Perkinsus marinus ATCC 50983]|uniref:protein-tyrosine-phosphatase n=1 Tax=Perkinsus marinus (strain ATCC 50983 / TXsc) TaxID=423536 RepID=C5KMQ2_PERM5|nr:dual specificity protein phosphatase, putative [Perkinsus marinus ATCC 50983]EER14210.1 dual specificity protein phosphatase, putative [Perkinsus marinus ATCC 50983]|eukprot:XP_002782415.1 dual specificity protein phosphatase, putative [Perkinsus marinus ATCC 50983]